MRRPVHQCDKVYRINWCLSRRACSGAGTRLRGFEVIAFAKTAIVNPDPPARHPPLNTVRSAEIIWTGVNCSPRNACLSNEHARRRANDSPSQSKHSSRLELNASSRRRGHGSPIRRSRCASRHSRPSHAASIEPKAHSAKASSCISTVHSRDDHEFTVRTIRNLRTYGPAPNSPNHQSIKTPQSIKFDGCPLRAPLMAMPLMAMRTLKFDGCPRCRSRVVDRLR
jgi:hypothetical protein